MSDACRGAPKHRMPRRSRASAMRLVLVLGLLGTVASAASTVNAAASKAPSHPKPHASARGASKPFSYCAQQYAVFRDRIPFVGIADPYVENDTTRYRDCSFGRMAAAHIGIFRGGLSWAQTQYPNGTLFFPAFDRLVAALARHRIRFFPVLLDPPRWDSTQPRAGKPVGMYPPRRPSDFAAWAADCVRRYGPHGSFWRENRTVPYLPVRAWQIWNEPNITTYWAPKPNLRAYVSLLRVSYRAIKRVDPHAIVVAAGLPFPGTAQETSYLTKLYRAGARKLFDALAVHTYAPSASGAFARLQAARAVMNRFGDSRKPIWDTEWAWAGGPPNVWQVSQAGQRSTIAAFLGLVRSARARLRLGELIYYGWRDDVYGPGPSWWGYHTGLFTQGLQPKPALSQFASAARRLDR